MESLQNHLKDLIMSSVIHCLCKGHFKISHRGVIDITLHRIRKLTDINTTLQLHQKISRFFTTLILYDVSYLAAPLSKSLSCFPQIHQDGRS